jgi:hypothetical protein
MAKRFLTDSLSGRSCIDVLIYAEKLKSETDLRKMVKIMEELLKIKNKRKRYLLTYAAI